MVARPGSGGTYQVWARLATLMGGANRGSWFIPEHGDEVLVAFEGGDPRRPYVLGGLWNGSDAPPETMDGAGNNYKKVLKTRNGVKVTLDDTDGSEQLILRDAGRPAADAKGRPRFDHHPGRQRQLRSRSTRAGSRSPPRLR